MIKRMLNDVYIKDLENITQLEIAFHTSFVGTGAVINLDPARFIDDNITLGKAFNNYLKSTLTDFFAPLYDLNYIENINDVLNHIYTQPVTLDDILNNPYKWAINNSFKIYITDVNFPYEDSFFKDIFKDHRAKFLNFFNNDKDQDIDITILFYILSKIFNFYVFDMYKVNLIYCNLTNIINEQTCLLLYNKDMGKYINLDSYSDIKFRRGFRPIKTKTRYYKEYYNDIDKLKTFEQMDNYNVLVTYYDIIKSTYIPADKIAYLGGFVGHKFYDYRKCSSMLLYYYYKDNDISKAIVNLSCFYTNGPLIRDNFKKLENVKVYNLMTLNLKSFLIDPDIKLGIEFIGTSTQTVRKTYEELKEYKIPKEKRDNAYEALYAICEEIDINVEDVLKNLDADFVKFYYKPKKSK